MTDAHALELAQLTRRAHELVSQLQAIAAGDGTVREALGVELESLQAATHRLVDTIQEHLTRSWGARRLVPTTPRRGRDGRHLAQGLPPMLSPRVTIDTRRPLVRYRARLTGRVHPSNTEVQVLVFSHDGRWYKQQRAVVRGSRWSVVTAFGYPESTGSYAIVAVAGLHIEPTRLDDIPAEAICSQTLVVERQ